jgi:hypothetical protein
MDLTTTIFASLTLLATSAFGFLIKILADKNTEIKDRDNKIALKDEQIESLNKRIDDLTDLVFEAVMIIKTNDSKTRVQKADQIIEKLKQLKS